MESVLGNQGRAVELCRTALSMKESGFNLVALGSALIRRTQTNEPAPEANIEEARRLSRKAVTLDHADPYAQRLVCEIALEDKDLASLRDCSRRLDEIASEDVLTLYFGALLDLSEGRYSRARGRTERAHALGLPDAPYRAILTEIDGRTPWYVRYGPLAGYTLAGWAVSLAVLLLSAWVLSVATLRSSRRLPTEAGGRASGANAAVRVLYRVVLWLCCAFYYVSLPIVILTVLVVGGGLIYAMLAVGHIPIKFIVIVVVFTIVTVWAVLKGIFVRVKDEDPGLLVNLHGNGKLRELLQEVASKVGTSPVDSVYLTPGSDVAVFERGGLLKQLSRRSERCLLLGIGVLDGFLLPQFKAVLAHEYGHLSNRDTAGGGFALAVRRSLQSTAIRLAQGGAAAWYNPAWLFLNGYYRVFLLISMGASRLQEILADRWAAFSYGAKNFEEGLRHVIDRGIRFGAHANAVINECARERRPLSNLYTYPPSGRAKEEEILEAIEKAIQAKPSAYDSHPSPSERFALVASLQGLPAEEGAGLSDDAWSLFEDRDLIEQAMTTQIRQNVLMMHGVEIPAPQAM
jgi:Zn-dependent protease with chaperone function